MEVLLIDEEIAQRSEGLQEAAKTVETANIRDWEVVPRGKRRDGGGGDGAFEVKMEVDAVETVASTHYFLTILPSRF